MYEILFWSFCFICYTLIGVVASIFFIPNILEILFVRREKLFLTVVLPFLIIITVIIAVFLFSLSANDRFATTAFTLGYIISIVIGIINVIKLK